MASSPNLQPECLFQQTAEDRNRFLTRSQQFAQVGLRLFQFFLPDLV